jgi:two-component system, NtrC family, sensor histidine kinase AtoS
MPPTFLPKSLRGKMAILSVIIVSIPILLSGYIMKTNAEEALLFEKQSKLFGAAHMLDQYLGSGFHDILQQNGALTAEREIKIKILNNALRGYTDAVATAYPGVGAGYYVKDLQAIVTYGPSHQYEGNVGMSIDASHPGIKVMETGQSQVEFGPLVRGNIMNAMLPIVRNGEVIGYIWANEFTDDVRAQLIAMDRNIYWSIGLGILFSIVLILWLSERIVRDVDSIKDGLEKLKFDLLNPITGLTGEMGEIAKAINEMAVSLENAKSLTENIIDSIADGIITVDTSSVITSLNKAAELLTGFSANEIVGKPYEEVFCQREHFQSLLIDTLRTGKNHIGIEVDYPVKDRIIHISTSTSLLRDNRENIIGTVVVFKDLTEKHKLEAQVKRAERLAALGELMAGVAHEIRNPLTGIKGFVQYLQESHTEEDLQEFMPVIVKEVDRVNRIIGELLYFARPCNAMYSVVDLNQLIRQTLVLVRNETTRNKIDFEITFSNELPPVEIDAEQFRQVFLNILINAIQAIESQGSIRIETGVDKDSGQVKIVFTDTGEGISEGDREKIFDPFYTTKEAGTGLGLAVVHRIIMAHHGRIKVEDNPIGGTIITLLVPIRHRHGDGTFES